MTVTVEDIFEWRAWRSVWSCSNGQYPCSKGCYVCYFKGCAGRLSEMVVCGCTGCLPTLATLPVWIGLYRALSNVANEVLCCA